MGFSVAGRSKAKFTERTFERFGASVEAHVHLQAAFCGERGVAHVAAEQFLTCKDKEAVTIAKSFELTTQIPTSGLF